MLMDFCCGLTMAATDVYELLERKPFRDAVVMINLQRGRDAWSNTMRASLDGRGDDVFDWLGAVSSWGYGPYGPPGSDVLCEKHRALVWLVYHSLDAWKTVAEPSLIDRIKSTVGYEDGFEDGVGMMWAGNYFKSADPRFYSYKSGALSFDSVVCRHPLGQMLALQSKDDVRHTDAFVERTHGHLRSQDMSRRISAMLAVRTGRLAS